MLHVELEKDGWEYVDMLWCQDCPDIVLSNHKLKSAPKYTVLITMHARPRRTNIMAIARRFVLTNASRAKKCRTCTVMTDHQPRQRLNDLHFSQLVASMLQQETFKWTFCIMLQFVVSSAKGCYYAQIYELVIQKFNNKQSYINALNKTRSGLFVQRALQWVISRQPAVTVIATMKSLTFPLTLLFARAHAFYRFDETKIRLQKLSTRRAARQRVTK